MAYPLGAPEGTVVGKTTLSAAVTTTDQTQIQLATLTITVGSNTTVTSKNPQWGLMIDGELMEVVKILAGTTVQVTRGMAGTAAVLHAKGQTVWAAPLGNLPEVNPNLSNRPPGRIAYGTIPISSTTMGTAVACAANNLYCADCYVPTAFVATGIKVSNGVVGANNGMVYLIDTAGQTVAVSALAATANNNNFQAYPFSPGPVLVPAGEYFLAYQQDGGSGDTIRMITGATYIDVLTQTLAGVFGKGANAWVTPTTFSANNGPVAYLY